MKGHSRDAAGVKRSGFTLIELLIVVAIIAILAAIAVPNFLEAQIRSKVSRVKSDMRTIATGLEAYYIDYNNYPVFFVASWTYPRDVSPPAYPPISAGISLSTPVSYLSTGMMLDPFHQQETYGGNQAQYEGRFITIVPGCSTNSDVSRDSGSNYFAGNFGLMYRAPRDCYGMQCFGPDGDDDVSSTGFPWTTANGNASGIYDPTNGTRSHGDIFRCSPRISYGWATGLTPANNDPFRTP